MISISISTDRKLRYISLDELKQIYFDPDQSETSIWVDLLTPTYEEEQTILIDLFGFHQLAVDDCRQERTEPRHGDHLPKVEDYSDYLFCIINPIDMIEQTHEEDEEEPDGRIHSIIRTRQVNAFLGRNYIVTHHYEPSHAIEQALTMCGKNPLSLDRGPDYIYHLILDDIVNDYSHILDKFDDEIDQLETLVFHTSGRTTFARIQAMKRSLIRLRRITTYQREMVYRLARGEFPLINEKEIAYYRNVFDHLARAVELVESYRDVITGLLDAHLSMTSNRMNEIMKILTIFSTFFLPLTFVAGVYGMNFKFMPELEWPYGYLFSWGVMLLTAGGMFMFFRKKKWM